MSSTEIERVRDTSRALSAADHPGTIRSFYPYWDVQYRFYLNLAVKALPREHFDFKPRAEMGTARQVILHIAEAERWWIGHIVGGLPYVDWVVEHPDPAQGSVTTIDAPDHEFLLKELEDSHRPTQEWLARPVSELSRVVAFQPPEGAERRYTMHWILDHLQEHEIHHRAQLNLYLRLLGIAPPSI